MKKEQTYTITLTRTELEKVCGGLGLACQVVTQQMANAPTAQLDQATELLKANRALLEKVAQPLVDADRKAAEEAKKGPLANPPVNENRKARRAKAKG